MKTVELSLFTTSIDVTLYRYNYIDNKLWVQIKNQLDYIEVNKTSVLVSREQLQSILLENYSDEISKIKSIGSKFFHNQVNTIYFMWMFIEEMKNLQYVKLTLDNDKSYSRVLNTEDGKSIEFDFKILTITIKLSDIFNHEEIESINSALHKLKLLEPGDPYNRLSALSIIDSVDNYLNELEASDNFTESSAVVSEFLELFTYKIERDNPLTLLITDY